MYSYKIFQSGQYINIILRGRSIKVDYNKTQDAVSKDAMEVFKDGSAGFFDLDVKIIASD